MTLLGRLRAWLTPRDVWWDCAGHTRHHPAPPAPVIPDVLVAAWIAAENTEPEPANATVFQLAERRDRINALCDTATAAHQAAKGQP